MDEDKRPAVCDKCSYSSGLAGYFGSRALARSQVIDIYKTSHHGRSSNNSATIISKLTRNGTTPFTYAVVTGGIYTANDNFKVATTKKTLRDTGKMNVNNFYTTYNNGNIVFTIYNNKAITVSTSS